MLPKRISEEEFQALLDNDLDDDFLDETSNDSGSSDCDFEEGEDDDINLTVMMDKNENELLTSELEPGTSNHWSQKPLVSREPFPFVGNSGVALTLEESNSPKEIFESFFDEQLMTLIVNQTNKFASTVLEEKRRSGKMMRKSRDLLWYETNTGEMYCFFALVILQGFMRKPSISSYHSTNPLIATPIFGKYISRDRFLLLLKYLQFSEYTTSTEPTRQFHIGMDLLLQKFKTHYTPQMNISIHESLLLWKGRLKWKRFSPLKSAKFGTECYILAESESGYVWDLIIHDGKDTPFPFEIRGISEEKKQNFSKPTKIVLSLVAPLLNKGYTLGIGNFYTSPELIEVLLANKTDCVGTVRFDRKLLCPEVKEKELEKGETIARFKDKIMHLKWRDKKNVNMLSTIYDDKMKDILVGGKTSSKPGVCINYKKFHLGKEDLLNQITTATLAKGGVKYYKKVFFRLMEITLHNCHVIYKRNGGKKSFLDFKLQLVEMLLTSYGKDVHWLRKPAQSPGLGSNPTRLTGRHFIIETGGKEKKVQRMCVYCAQKKKRKRSIYSCDTCKLTLCVTPCFKRYHTEERLE